MLQTQGKIAFVTGAASGIGLGIARTFARAGTHIALIDVEAEPLARAKKNVESLGVRAVAIEADVSNAEQMNAAARRIESELGSVDFLFNNAGVDLVGKSIDEVPYSDFDWILGVNLKGVLNGIKAIVPQMRARGAGGYVVNTASIAGLRINPGKLRMGPYAMTKYAVVAISESLRQDLEEDNIKVSVFCPGPIRTNIWQSGRNRPAHFGGPFHRDEGHPFWQHVKTQGLHPDRGGEILMHSMKEGPMFIFTHPQERKVIEARHRQIMDGFDLCERITAEMDILND